MSIPTLLRSVSDRKPSARPPRSTSVIRASVILGLTMLAVLAIPERASMAPGSPTPIDLAVMQLVNRVGLVEPPSLEALVFQTESIIQVLLMEKVALVDIPGVEVDVESKLTGHAVVVEGDGTVRASLREGTFRGTVDGREIKATANGVELTMPPSATFLSRLSIQKGRIELGGAHKTVGDVVEFAMERSAVDDIHYTVRTNRLEGEVNGQAVQATESGKEYRRQGTTWWATVEKYAFLATGADGVVDGSVSNQEACNAHTRCSEFGTARLLAEDVKVQLQQPAGVASLKTKGLEVRINGGRVTTSIEKGKVQVEDLNGNVTFSDKVKDYHNEFPLE